MIAMYCLSKNLYSLQKCQWKLSHLGLHLCTCTCSINHVVYMHSVTMIIYEISVINDKWHPIWYSPASSRVCFAGLCRATATGSTPWLSVQAMHWEQGRLIQQTGPWSTLECRECLVSGTLCIIMGNTPHYSVCVHVCTCIMVPAYSACTHVWIAIMQTVYTL